MAKSANLRAALTALALALAIMVQLMLFSPWWKILIDYLKDAVNSIIYKENEDKIEDELISLRIYRRRPIGSLRSTLSLYRRNLISTIAF